MSCHSMFSMSQCHKYAHIKQVNKSWAASTSSEQKVKKVQIASLHAYTTLMYFWLSFLFLWLCSDAIINFATQLWSLSAVKKDVIACSSISQEDGRNIPKQSDIKKSSVKTYDKRQDSVGLYFWKGLTIRYSLCKVQLPGMSRKRRKRVFFFFLWRDVWNKFML